MAKSIKGRNGDDNLTGTDRGDRIDGKGGNDTIFGLGGNDDIKGGKGNDIIDGGAGNDEIDGGQGDDHLSGGAGNDEIIGDSGNDILFGGDGDDAMYGDRSNGSGGASGSGSGAPVTFNDYLDGGAGNDLMVGGQGDDTLLGGTGNDILWGDSIERSGSGGRGSGSGSSDAGTFNDYLDGGAGDDQIHAGIGDDVAGYTAAENVGATDIYSGGAGIDTLSLYLTGDEYAAAAAEIAAYQAFIAANTNAVTGEANSNEFQFSTFDLTASEFEDVNVHAAINDAVEIGEDDGATVFASVLDNDLGSQDVTGVSVVAGTEPSEGVLVFNADGSYSFDPAGAFEHLAVGETATVSFDYLVNYANGGSNTATVTITITGANDAPIITAADATGSVNEDDGQGVTAAATPVLAEVEGNDGFATAQLIDRADLRIADNADLGSDRLASISVTGEITDQGDTDNYQIQVAAGEIVTIDIDYAALYGTGQTPGYADGFGLDSLVRIYDANGTLIGSNDDASTAAGGEGSLVVTDSYLQFTAPADGIYYIQVGDFDGYYDQYGIYSQGPYTMQVSVDDPNGELTDSGSISFGDVDLSDGHGVTITSGTAGALGTLTASVSDASTGDGSGQIDWVYTVNKAELQFLATGETRTETFTVTVSDGNGGTVQQEVVITLVGENDAPVIETTGTQGDVTEDTSLTDGGVLAFSDVDLTDNHVVTTQQVGGVGGGVFSVTMTDDSTGDGTGEIAWSFEIQPGEFDWLSEGQTRLQRHLVTLDDGNGGVTEQLVNVIITGTNDAVEITSAVDSGSVTEDALVYEGVVASETPVIAEGVQGEVQIIDRADLRIAPNGDLGNDGLPSITVVGEVTDPGEHDSYSIALTAGEIVTIDVDFAAGYGDQTPGYPAGFGLDALVYIYDASGTLLNSNDDAALSAGGAGSIYTQDSYLQFTAPADGAYTIVVTNFDGSTSYGQYVLQLSVDSSSNGNLTDSGTVTFTDVDLADGHGVSVAANGTGYLGELTAIVSDDSTGDGTGEIEWTFAVGNPAIQFLGEGETLTQSYTITVDDGQGGEATQDVTITITGTNDAPVVESGSTLGDTFEDQISDASGVLVFSDIDLSDNHIISFTPVDEGYYGSFSAGLADDSTGDGTGQIGWSFSVDPAEVQFLSDGQRLLQRYIVTLDDGHGGVVEQLVNIRIFGTNDAVEITSAVDSADLVDGAGLYEANGTIEFGDVDTYNGHYVDYYGNEGGQLGSFYAYLTDDSYGDGAGQVRWDFYVDPSQLQALGEGETLTQTYTVAIDDGQGGRAEQIITITLNGQNDAPVSVVVDGGLADEDQGYHGYYLQSFSQDPDQGDSVSLDSIVSVTSSNPGRVIDYFIDPGNNDFFGMDMNQWNDLGEGESETVTVVYRVTDTQGAVTENTLTFTAEGRNDAPTAFVLGADAIEQNQGYVGLNVMSAINDVDLTDTLTLDSILSVTTSNPARVFDYFIGGNDIIVDTGFFNDLAEGESETLTFVYAVSDGHGGSVENTVDVTVLGANDAPTAFAITAQTTEDSAPFEINLISGGYGYDIDQGGWLDESNSAGFSIEDASASSDNPARSVVFALDPSTGVVSIDPAQFNDLAEGESETVTLSFNLVDDHGASVPNTLTLTINGANDAPVIVSGDTVSVDENASGVVYVAGASDADGDGISYSLSGDDAALFGIDATSGEVSFLAAPDFEAPADADGDNVYDIVVQASDGRSTSGQAVAITVTDVDENQAPVAADVAFSGTTGRIVGLVLGGSHVPGAVVSEFLDTDGNGYIDTVTQSTALGNPGNNYGIVSGDLDGDGDADFVISGSSAVYSYTNVGDTDGDGQDDYVVSQLTPYRVSTKLALVDLNGDGLLDLVGLRSGSLTQLINAGDANGNGLLDDFDFQSTAVVNQSNADGLAMADLNGDGLVDLVTGSGVGGYPTVISYNLGDIDNDGVIEFAQVQINDAYSGQVTSIDTGDIDGDGDIDFVVSRSVGAAQVVYLNQGDTDGDGNPDFLTMELQSGASNTVNELADIDGDGDLDVLSADQSGNFRIALNQGDTDGDGIVDFTYLDIATGGHSVYGMAIGDMDGDGDLDVVLSSRNANNRGRILFNEGDADGDGSPDFHVEAVDGFGYSFDVEFLYAGGSAGTQQVQEDGQVLTGQFDASDAEGDALTYVITSAPSEGSVTNNGDGTFDFDPGSDFQDLDEGETRDVSFQYHVVDAVGGVSNTATVTVTVRGTYDAPVVNEAPLVTYTSPPGEGPERMLGEGDPPADTIVQHWNGQIGYSDEASDSQTISFEPLGPAPFGTFEAHLVDDANGDGAGQIEWSFTVDNADLPAEDGSLFYTVFIEDSQGAVTEQVVEIAYYRILDLSGEADDLAATLSTKGVVQTLIPENVDSGADKSDGLPAPVMDGVDDDSIPLASVDGLGLVNNLGTVSIEMGPDGFLTLDDADFTDLNQATAGDGAAITTLIATGEFGLGHDVGLPTADTGGFVTLTVEADGFVPDIQQIFLPEAFMGSDGMLVLADNDTGIDLPTVLDTAEGW